MVVFLEYFHLSAFYFFRTHDGVLLRSSSIHRQHQANQGGGAIEQST
jgi:hypothetical protein